MSKNKGTKAFRETIKKFLQKEAFKDEMFARMLDKENKNLDDCIAYILGTVQESGEQGWTDDEIYGMAIHYYTEDDIKVGDFKQINAIVNHHPQLSPEEIKELKEKARNQVIQEEKDRIRGKGKVKEKPKEKDSGVKTLF